MTWQAAPPVVMDTNVLVAGACRHSESLAYAFLCGVLTEQVPLILTPAIVLEYQDEMLRPAVLELTGLTHEESTDLITDLVALSLNVQTHFSWRPNLRDEGDSKFVDAAIHAAAIIVTYNDADYQSGDLPRHGWLYMSPDEFLTRYRLERRI